MTARTLCLHVLLAAILQPGSVWAALDPETKKPYQLEVVLHLNKQRSLTEVFREQVERELGDSLQDALGELARVKVVSKHPRLADVLSKGLQRGLDEWRDRSPVKTHFVLIDYSGEQYVIQARQHDGLTGLSSPVARQQRTLFRQLVAKTAALLVAEDFGLVGTVRLPANPNEVKVDLKGADLGVPLKPWIKPGEVFVVVQVPVGNGPCAQLPWTVLQVQKLPGEDGPECICRLYAPGRPELKMTPQTAGYRCLKVATGKFPLRVQLMNVKEKPVAPVEGVLVLGYKVRRQGFTGEEQTLFSSTLQEGVIDTAKRQEPALFDHLAFLTVELVGGKQANVPVPLVGEQVVQVPLSVSTDSNIDQVRFRADGWTRAVAESLQVQNHLMTEVLALSKQQDQLAQAMTKSREAIQRTEEDVKRLKSERTELLKEANDLGVSRPNLTASEERLKKIEAGKEELARFLAQLEKNDKEINDPQRKKWLNELERARLLVKEAEVAQALEIYEQVVKGLNSPAVKEEMEQLKKDWEPRDEKHRKARQFIWEEWSKPLSAVQLAELMKETNEPNARAVLKECESVRDLFGLKKLLDVTVNHSGRLLEELGKLNAINVDDERKIEEIKDANGKLEKLAQEANVSLQQLASDKK